MSTKIWEAYRIKEGYDHWDVLMTIKRRARKETIKPKLLELFGALMEGFRKGDEGLLKSWQALWPERELRETWNLIDMHDYVSRQYRNQLGNPQKDPFDFDVSLAVRRHEGRWLIIPYGNHYGFLRGCLDFMATMEELEDYHYQNQSDAPDPLPDNWDERERVWHYLCDDGRWQDFIIVDIVSHDAWFDVSPAWDQSYAELRKAMNEGMSAEDAVNKYL